ncbi:MAG: macro domain-containing protein [Chloroflexi bacterium]|nr:macro domain-containing protein [Chloroflexota bacterium]
MAEITLQQGDIADVDTEAVVNAANNRLVMGAGVAGAIKRRGGQEIEDEAVRKGPIPIGEAAATGAGKLKARYVIHAAVMGMDFRTDGEKIGAATRNSLLRAEELGVKSVAFPALGTGVGGFPYAECARIMLDEVRAHLAQHPASSLREVRFVLYGADAYRAFSEALRPG